MTSFREIRFNEKKDAIFSAAAKIFAEKGYEKTTLEEIAAALNMTKSNIYYYFKGKEDILLQSMIRAHSLANEFLNNIAEKGHISPEVKLTMAIKEHIKVLTKTFVYGTLRQQELLLPEKSRKSIIAERDKFQETLMSIVQEGIEVGDFRKVNLKMVSMAILGATNWVARWYSPDGRLTGEEIGEEFADYLVAGLLKH